MQRSDMDVLRNNGILPAYCSCEEISDRSIQFQFLNPFPKSEGWLTLNETRGTMHGFDIATKAPTTLAAMEQRIAFMKRMI